MGGRDILLFLRTERERETVESFIHPALAAFCPEIALRSVQNSQAQGVFVRLVPAALAVADNKSGAKTFFIFEQSPLLRQNLIELFGVAFPEN